jgi:tRNA 2-thiouridine synthesizing protein A
VSDLEPALRLDQRGRRCPLPIIALGTAIDTVDVAAVIELLADDPAADPDVRAWCRMRGQELLEAAGGRFLVRRLR